MADTDPSLARRLSVQDCVAAQRERVAALTPGTVEHRIADEVLSLLVEGQRLRDDVERLIVDGGRLIEAS